MSREPVFQGSVCNIFVQHYPIADALVYDSGCILLPVDKSTPNTYIIERNRAANENAYACNDKYFNYDLKNTYGQRIPSTIIERCVGVIPPSKPITEPEPNDGKGGISEPNDADKKDNPIVEPKGGADVVFSSRCCQLANYEYSDATQKCENGNNKTDFVVCPANSAGVNTKIIGQSNDICISSLIKTNMKESDTKCCPLDGYVYKDGKCVDNIGNQTDVIDNNYYSGKNSNGDDICVPYCAGNKKRVMECDSNGSLFLTCK